MSWFVPAFDLWLSATLAGLSLTAAASLAVLVIRQPARKIRVIQLTLVGLLVLPALVLLPGYPRLSWWPAVGEIKPVAMQTKSPPAKPGAVPISIPSRVQPPALPGGSSSTPLVDPAAPEPASFPVDPVPLANVRAADPQPTQPVVTAPIAATPIKTTPSRSTPPAVAAPREPARFSLPSLPDYRLLVVTAYLGGVALFACWWLIGRVALWRLVRTVVPAEPVIRSLLDDVALGQSSQHAAARVRLLVSPRAAQPCAFGWLRPTIVLPQRLVKELTPDQLRLALSHEWSHVARGDIRTWMLAGLVRLVHFHQPLVWLLRRELRISQDYLADAAAASRATPEDYAELLTTLSQMLRPTPLSPGLGIAPRQSELYRRVVMLVDQSRPLERTIPRRWNVAAVMLGVTLIACVATLRAEPEEGEPTSAASETRSLGQPIALPGGSSATPSTDQLAPPLELGAPVAAHPRARQALLNDPTDRRDIALQLVTVRRQLETLLRTREDLQSRLSRLDANSEERQTIEQHLAAVDDGLADTSQRFAEIQAHFDAASLKDDAKAYAAAADWEHSGDKRRLLEALLAELDEHLKLRDSPFKHAAEQTNSKDRAPLESQINKIDAKRVEIVHRIEELLQLQATPRALQPQASEPFRGRIRPGDILNIEIIGGFPGQVPPRTVEPDGRIVVSSAYTSDRCEVAGLTLTEAGEAIAKLIRPVLKNEPKVVVTYAGHDDGVVAEGQPAPPRASLTSRKESTAPRSAPFSGRIRPGDILGIEIVGGFPTQLPPTRTVEPDGNVVLGAVHGPASRVNVAGQTLIEAGETIKTKLKEVLKDPKVVVTYEGHNDGIVAERAAAEATSAQGKPALATNPVVLQPLDTIEVILPLKSIRSHIKEVNGNPTEVTTGDPPRINNTYLIEPDGRIALPEAAGRLALAGLTEEAAGEKLREHLAKTVFPRKALPTTRVLRRGRAIFADGKQPAADYKIQPGDFLVLRSTSSGSWGTESESQVDAEGNFGWGPQVNIAGMTLEEAQRAFRKEVKSSAGTPSEQSIPWVVTLGGWREEADPQMIDLIEGTDATQLLRMQEEMQELKAMIRRLQAE